MFPTTRALFDDAQMEEERRLAYVAITRARRRLFISHARTRALYNTRNANPISRFVDEIPKRLIVEGAGRSEIRRVPPPTQRGYGQQRRFSPEQAGSGGVRTGEIGAPRREVPGGMGIPGVQRGMRAAPQAQPRAEFRIGETVHHTIFGRGEIVGITGSGAQQRVRIRFSNGTERSFAAGVAPIIKVVK